MEFDKWWIENLIWKENNERWWIQNKEWHERRFVEGCDFESQKKKLDYLLEKANEREGKIQQMKKETTKMKLEIDEIRRWIDRQKNKCYISDSDSE